MSELATIPDALAYAMHADAHIEKARDLASKMPAGAERAQVKEYLTKLVDIAQDASGEL